MNTWTQRCSFLAHWISAPEQSSIFLLRASAVWLAEPRFSHIPQNFRSDHKSLPSTSIRLSITMPLRLHISAASFPFVTSKIAPTRHAFSLYRAYAVRAPPPKTKDKKDKKKQRTEFINHDLRKVQQFSLVEAMRYIRAMEVGRDPMRTKYDIAVKLKTLKNGPQLRDRVRLPTPVRTDTRICVIAEGKVAEDALKAGATLAGTDEVFELVRIHPYSQIFY